MTYHARHRHTVLIDLHRFTCGNHIELPQYELPRAQASKAADTMAAAARSWWRSVVSEPYSFQKAALFVGVGNESYSNIMAMYAHERTPANVTLLDKGATGFVSPGDRMCWNVKVRLRLSVFLLKKPSVKCGILKLMQSEFM